MGARRRRRANENLKTLERLHSKDSRSFRDELLGKIEASENELGTAKNGKVQDHLRLESSRKIGT